MDWTDGEGCLLIIHLQIPTCINIHLCLSSSKPAAKQFKHQTDTKKAFNQPEYQYFMRRASFNAQQNEHGFNYP